MSLAPRPKTKHLEVLPLLPGKVRFGYSVNNLSSSWSEDMTVEELKDFCADGLELAEWCDVHGAKEGKA